MQLDLERLGTWFARHRGIGKTDRRTREVAAAALLFTSGGGGMAVTFLPGLPPTYDVPLVRILCAITLLLAILEFFVGDRWPSWRHHVFEGVGTLLIGVAIHATGGGDVSVATAFASILVIIDATVFLSAMAMLAHSAALIVVDLVALSLVPNITPASTAYIVAILAGSAAVSYGIIRQREELRSDPITGLLNQRGFERSLDEQMLRKARGGNTWLALFRLDVVGPVRSGDRLSPTDEQLQDVTGRWQPMLPSSAVFGHFGGGRFAVHWTSSSLFECESVIRRFTDQVKFERSAFAGCAVVEFEDTASTLSNRATSALLVAKRLGFGAVVRYPAAHNGRIQIREAIAAGQFSVVFQPIVRLSDHEIIGAEALVRWQHPKHGLLQPGQFITEMELSGAIIDLGEWVLAEACRHAVGWSSVAGRLPYVSVNVSGRELEKAGFAETVFRALAAAGLRGERLVLELIETDCDNRSDAVVDNLMRLRQVGIRIAIDDFGVGHSNFMRLKDLDADILKIDRSFVAEVKDHRAPTPITSALVAISHVLDLPTVAEGVKTIEQAAWLRARGCHAAQGYLYSAPVDARAMSAMLSRPLVDNVTTAMISCLVGSVPDTWLGGGARARSGDAGLHGRGNDDSGA